MAREIEIKLRVTDLPGLREKLRHMGARPAHAAAPRLHEWNVVFDTPGNRLAKSRQLLRIRTETPQRSDSATSSRTRARTSTLTFKHPLNPGPHGKASARRHKVLEELETSISNPQEMAHILAGLGFRPAFCYEKYRSLLKLPPRLRWARDLKLDLDETPIGNFLELEGPASAIDRAARELGYSRRDYIVKNYYRLYAEDCRRLGDTPRDMIFRAP